ncbi:hypothetical protein C8R43DRAFT_507323 [Mycena crocata]|nr:hypothetical protein C8R43DRAFT_507323 [Mycena crocata]
MHGCEGFALTPSAKLIAPRLLLLPCILSVTSGEKKTALSKKALGKRKATDDVPVQDSSSDFYVERSERVDDLQDQAFDMKCLRYALAPF